MATKIDYNQVREMMGVVVSDGTHEYVVSDYRLSTDCYQLWCKNRQEFYLTSYAGLHDCYDVISG